MFRKFLVCLIALVSIAANSMPSHAANTSAAAILTDKSDETYDVSSDFESFDIVNMQAELDDVQMLTFSVEFIESKEYVDFIDGEVQLKLSFDSDADGFSDYYINLDDGGVIRDSFSEEEMLECGSTTLNLDGSIASMSIASSCFGGSKSIRFKAELTYLEEIIESTPDVGWHTASLDMSKLIKCSAAHIGEYYEIDNKGWFCMLVSGTPSKGQWKLILASKVSDSSFLKMFVCNKTNSGKSIEINRKTSSKNFTCFFSSGKWAFVSDNTIAAIKAKAASDAQKKKLAGLKYSTQKAFYSCKLQNISHVNLDDGGKTIAMDAVGLYSLDTSPQFSDYLCVANYLKMPSFLRSKVEATRALDGIVEGKWSDISAFWNYHPDNGMNITFTLVK